MAKISPFLQMLLTNKRRDPYQDFDPQESEAALAQQPQGPTIGIRPRRVQPAPPIVPAQPIAQEPTIPIQIPQVEGMPEPFGSSGEPFSPTLAMRPRRATGPDISPMGASTLKPRTALEDAADTVRKYEQGLHKDPKTGEWIEHKRNKGLQILEGLGTVAASGVGINLQRLLHPQGTPPQRARRALSTEMALEDQGMQARAAESNIATQSSLNDYRDAQTTKIANEPPENPAAKAKAEAIKLSLGLHKQPFDPQNPNDRALLEEAARQGIIINPETYGEKDESGRSVQFGEEVMHDGRRRKIQFNPKSQTWEPSKSAAGDVITDVPKPEKGEAEIPDTSPALGEQESRFRENAKAAQAAAEQAELQIKKYIEDQKRTTENYDPAKDENVATMAAEARRQREFQQDQTKRADELVVEKIKTGGKVQAGRAKMQAKSSRTGRASLNEDQVREAAKAAGLDPDIAIKRARARGQLR